MKQTAFSLGMILYLTFFALGCGHNQTAPGGEAPTQPNYQPASSRTQELKLPRLVLAGQGRHHHYLMTNPGYELYFDTSTIKYDRDEAGKVNTDVIDVWLVGSFNPLGVQRSLQTRVKQAKPIEGWKDLDYELLHYLINQKGMYYRTLQFIWVDKKGNVLDNVDLEPYNLGWDWVSNSSVMELWVKEISTYAVNHHADMLVKSQH